MTYSFFTNPKKTPQTEPIPGRQAEMVQGRSGAWLFKAESWQQLRRCLLMGTASGSYYAGKQVLTQEFAEILQQAVAADPDRVAQEITYASDGHALNNSAPLLALVFLSLGDSPAAKAAFQATFPAVVRTASHFYEWLGYSKSLRGFGKSVRLAGQQWLSTPDVKTLAYQLLKYQQRQGFAHRDILRLFHVKPPSPDHDRLFQWACEGWETLPPGSPSPALSQIWWYEWLKRNPAGTCRAIEQGRLTHEMVAPIGEMTPDAWALLVEEMPIGALLRNLGSLTQLGVLGISPRRKGKKSKKNRLIERVAQVLSDRQHLRRGRIHPIDILKALKTYRSGGKLGQSRKTWQPLPEITEILETALDRAFEALPATGQTFLHAVDISGSMGYYTVGSMALTCCEIAATMALASAKAEKNTIIRGFSTTFRDLGITQQDSFASAMQKAMDNNFGGTDAAVAYEWAIKHKQWVDCFCFWTDCESWAGRQHPSQALAEYRRKINPKAKAVYITLVPDGFSLVDPQDPQSWDIAGFDPSTPRLLQLIALGEI